MKHVEYLDNTMPKWNSPIVTTEARKFFAWSRRKKNIVSYGVKATLVIIYVNIFIFLLVSTLRVRIRQTVKRFFDKQILRERLTNCAEKGGGCGKRPESLKTKSRFSHRRHPPRSHLTGVCFHAIFLFSPV